MAFDRRGTGGDAARQGACLMSGAGGRNGFTLLETMVALAVLA
ncbi:MAG: prepilin-type N-terminal cleavage/methylation domain-containing protein, partial [Magnetococcales bacterium]|nr:prepilin-type N-terminal cleavage/methylation domain-containing protein [Magnetococcales bacterium]